MPRTRRSTSALLATRNNANLKTKPVDEVEVEVELSNTSPTNSNGNRKNTRKKRTVSDRSPAVVKGKGLGAAPSQIQQINNMNVDYNSPDKENLLPTPTKAGVTPYWKVAEERGISPRMTRSASKRESKIPRYAGTSPSSISSSEKSKDDDCAKGLFQLEISPPNQNAIRQRETQAEKDREAKLNARRRSEGNVLFLSPDHKKAKSSSSSSISSSRNSNYKPLTPMRSPQRTPSRALVTTTDIEEVKNELAETKSLNYDLVKQNALLKAEKAILKKDAEDKEALIIKVAKLESKLESKHTAMEHTQEVLDLTLRVDDMQGEMRSFQKSRDDSRKMGDKDNERVVGEYERLIQTMKYASNEQRVRLEEKEALLREKEKVIENLKNAKAEKENEEKEAGEKESNKALAAELDAKERELQELKEKYKKFKKNHEEVTKKHDDTFKHARSTLTKANNEISKRTEQAMNLESKLAEKEKRMNELESQLKNRNVAMKEEADASFLHLNEEIESIQANLTTTHESKVQLQTELEDSKTTIVTLEKVKDQLQREIDELNDELLENKKAVESVEAQLGSIQKTLAAAEEGKVQMEGEYEALQNELEDNKQTVRTLQGQIESMQTTLAVNEETNSKLQTQTAALNAELERSEQMNQKLEAELAQSREECEHLKSLLRKANEEKEENIKIITTTRNQVDMSAQEANSLRSQLEESESRALSLQEECRRQVDQITNEKKAADARIAELDAMLASKAKEYSDERGNLLEKIAEKEKLIQQKENGINAVQKRCMAMMAQLNKFDVREAELLQKILLQDQVRRSLHNKVMQLSGNIRVYIRVRPRLPSEASKSEEQTFTFPSVYDSCSQASSSSSVKNKPEEDLTKKFIVATEPFKDRGGLSQRRKKLKFGFDNVFSPYDGQEDIWKATEPLVQSAVDGYNVCVFAYGQTGSGKTYTMLGNEHNPGVITKAVTKMFESKKLLEDVSGGSTSAQISVELLEIYNETVRDLMSRKNESYKKLNISMNGNEPIGNKVISVSNEGEVFSILSMAQKRRCVKATMSNEESSRSHLIFTMNFTVKNEAGVIRNSKLHICDLAGSERLKHSQSYGSTLKETQHINKSLSTLSNVIEKLQAKSSHVPFRESKLTYLLNNSLGGDSKTLAIICCNPLSEHFQESSCSLRFAQKLNKVELKAMGSTSC